MPIQFFSIFNNFFIGTEIEYAEKQLTKLKSKQTQLRKISGEI